MSARPKNPSKAPPPVPHAPKLPAAQPARPAELQKSGPIQVRSMKTPGAVGAPQPPPQEHRPVPRVKLRAISEVSPLKHAQPQNLGYLAPPRDPAEVRARHVRDYVIWGCASVIVASIVALGIWFLAR